MSKYPRRVFQCRGQASFQDWLARLFVIGLITVLAGCGGTANKKEISEAKSLPPLEVPPDLVRPYGDDKLTQKLAPPKTDKQAADCRCDDRPPSIGERVLPQGKGVQRVREGQHRWLLVSAEPEQVWPLAKKFFEMRAYRVARDEPEVGLLETDWKNRFEKPDSDGLPNWREKLRIRIEPAKQPGSSEIYLSQQNSERVKAEKADDNADWVLRAPDNERAIEMMNRLAVFLAAENVEDSVALAPIKSRIDSDDDGSVLVVEAGFEKVWRRTGIALDALGFVIEDRNRGNGVYMIYNELPSGKTEEELKYGKPESATVREEFRLQLKEKDGNTVISVHNKAGEVDKSNVAGHVLNLLRGQFQ